MTYKVTWAVRSNDGGGIPATTECETLEEARQLAEYLSEGFRGAILSGPDMDDENYSQGQKVGS